LAVATETEKGGSKSDHVLRPAKDPKKLPQLGRIEKELSRLRMLAPVLSAGLLWSDPSDAAASGAVEVLLLSGAATACSLMVPATLTVLLLLLLLCVTALRPAAMLLKDAVPQLTFCCFSAAADDCADDALAAGGPCRWAASWRTLPGPSTTWHLSSELHISAEEALFQPLYPPLFELH
jgi:hypothetical protein